VPSRFCVATARRTVSLRGLLMPAISARLLAPERQQRLRDRAERARVARGEPHRVLCFLQVDDPYSALLAASLPRLAQRHAISIEPRVVPPPSDAAAPQRARLVDWSRRDAALLARHHGLAFADRGAQPAADAIARTESRLVAAIERGQGVDAAGPLLATLWSSGDAAAQAIEAPAAADRGAVTRHLAEADALRSRLGHYLGAMLHYGGEWYWGIDRLHHLERRLQALGVQRPGVEGLLFPPGVDPDPVRTTGRPPHAGTPGDPAASGDTAAPAPGREPPPAIDFFVSLRSPYSAIAAPRVLALGRALGAPVRLRYLLPMAMRGLPVPAAKRRYIAFDAAREARLRGVPFGRIADPLGEPTRRGLALMPLAERTGHGPDYLLSFMRGVWAEGIDAGTDRGLRRIAERAGLAWTDCSAALDDSGWEAAAEGNRAELFALGLWGVPSFRVGDFAVWGQDRLWAVEDALRAANARDGTAR
jgi:2-hydroxychromene-2-carboxylate isomerase